MAEFMVSYWTKKDGRLIVDGRCTVGELYVGDVFITLAQLSPAIRSDPYAAPPVRSFVGDVNYRIAEIAAYERSLDSLDEGMTGRLTLDVLKGIEHAGTGDALNTD
jgi:hypothetical protein